MERPLPQTPSALEADRLIGRGPAAWRLGRLGRPGRALGRLAQRFARGKAPYQQQVDRNLLESIGHVDARVDTIVARLDARDASEGDAHASLADRLIVSEQLMDDLVVASEMVRARLAEVAARIGDPDELPRLEDLLAASRARPYVAGSAYETWDEPEVGEVMGFSSNHLHSLAVAETYIHFEDRFRGPEERVKDLQRPYLPLLAPHAPVLDAGCGRGEMLDLLRERDIVYHGLDVDDAMIGRCRAKDHASVEVADVNAHLASVPDGRYGAIFSAQVIEHLPPAALVEMLRLAARKLRPGGLFVAETVNPHAPHALRVFWTDITHQHPIFPEVALALCELAGFASAYVFHPTGTGAIEVDPWTQSAYAVVATTTGAPVEQGS